LSLFLIHALFQINWNFSVCLLEGKEVKIDSLLGDKITVVSFWATWCSPCKEELSFLNKLYAVYRDSGMQVIAINTDSPRNIKKVKPMVNSYEWKFLVVIDPEGKLMRKFGVRALPTTFFINSSGEIIDKKVGFSKKDKKKIEKLIKKEVKEKKE